MQAGCGRLRGADEEDSDDLSRGLRGADEDGLGAGGRQVWCCARGAQYGC